LETSLKIHPSNAEAQIDRACALSELGRKQEAEALFQELPNLMGETVVLRTGKRDVQQPARLASASATQLVPW
jgi:hypothetical protein